MAGNGRNMRMLRDLRLSTKVLILHQMVKQPGVGQRDLAATLEEDGRVVERGRGRNQRRPNGLGTAIVVGEQ